jgi:hypothetical protein
VQEDEEEDGEEGEEEVEEKEEEEEQQKQLIHRLCWERTVRIYSWFYPVIPNIFPDSTSITPRPLAFELFPSFSSTK